MSYKGINWGKFAIEQDCITLSTLGHGHQIMSLKFKDINNSTINKNDIIIQTTADDLNSDDFMCQIRFHVESPKQQQDMEQEKKSQQQGQGNSKKNNNIALTIYKDLIEKAKIGEFSGDSLATINQVNFVVPRGKHTVDFYQKNLRLHGITFNYSIDYKNILKGFLLPMANQSQTSIVLQLDKPIYQGQTVYPYIVIQIKKQVQVQIKTKSKPQYQKIPHLSKLKPQYAGPLFQVFVQLLKTVAQINLIVPSGDYKSKSGQSCIKCNVKAQAGWLYILKKSLIFIPKPVTYFKTDDIRRVEFNRLGSTNKQFDMKITLQSEKKSIEYIGVERQELQGLVEYFKARQVQVLVEQATKIVPDVQDDESQDADFEVGEGQESQSGQSDQEESDSKQKQVKQEN